MGYRILLEEFFVFTSGLIMVISDGCILGWGSFDSTMVPVGLGGDSSSFLTEWHVCDYCILSTEAYTHFCYRIRNKKLYGP